MIAWVACSTSTAGLPDEVTPVGVTGQAVKRATATKSGGLFSFLRSSAVRVRWPMSKEPRETIAEVSDANFPARLDARLWALSA
jgi:hypothetical protein